MEQHHIEQPFMDRTDPKICVIGAGPCGITTAKNLLQEGLTNITVFEKSGQLGGNWVFDEQNEHSSVYETTHIISSIHLSKFEDFPMPPGYPDYPSHRQMLHYFNVYAEHFKLHPYIRFNTTVEHVTRGEGNQWHVTYRDERGQHQEIFDFLLVANGHHWDPVMPSYPGHFSGHILHSHEYKKASPFKGQRVLVVGAGNSACDIAVEVSRVSSKTSMSIRRGQHIFPKFIFGKATDIAFSKINWMPFWCRQWFAAMVIRMVQGKLSKYQLKKPLGRPLDVHPTINSELLYFIRHGKVFPQHGIDRFDGNMVYFVNGKKEEVDTIIFATGYRVHFPFFSKDLVDYGSLTRIPLYRKMMHPEMDNLYFIGLFQPQGCIWPLADHQAKIAARMISGALPRPTHLSDKIKKEIRKFGSHFKDNVRHALEVDYHIFRRQLLKELKKK
jgi:hypothetical protein